MLIFVFLQGKVNAYNYLFATSHIILRFRTQVMGSGSQLVEQSLLSPEVRSLNPAICKNYIEHLYCQVYWKDEK